MTAGEVPAYAGTTKWCAGMLRFSVGRQPLESIPGTTFTTRSRAEDRDFGPFGKLRAT